MIAPGVQTERPGDAAPVGALLWRPDLTGRLGSGSRQSDVEIGGLPSHGAPGRWRSAKLYRRLVEMLNDYDVLKVGAGDRLEGWGKGWCGRRSCERGCFRNHREAARRQQAAVTQHLALEGPVHA